MVFKGRLISKGPLVSSFLPKKRTKKFNFTTMVPQVELFPFVFLGELKTPKRHFEIYWPLEKNGAPFLNLHNWGIFKQDFFAYSLVRVFFLVNFSLHNIKHDQRLEHRSAVHVILPRFYHHFIQILYWFYPDFKKNHFFRFYPNLILILSWFYPDFILILPSFYTIFFTNSPYQNFIQIKS